MKDKIGLALIALVSLGFLGGAVHLVYWQQTGEPTMATVNSCQRRGRAISCRGSWMVNGRVSLGEIENTNSDDVGQRIEVRVLEGKAIKPGLRLPIILALLGLGLAAAGWHWWTKERLRIKEPAPVIRRPNLP